MVHKNSVEAYYEIRSTLGPMRFAVYAAIRDYGPITRKKLSAVMELPPNEVTPRVTELLKRKIIREGRNVKNPSGRQAALLEIVAPEDFGKDYQGGLF